MAKTFPLTLEQFFDTLPVKSATFSLSESIELSENGSGEVLTADLGPRLWEGTVTLRPGEYGEMEAIKALTDTLRYAGRSFMVAAIPVQAPQNDPTGTLLGAATPLIDTVASNNRDITIKGLPAGYVLKSGDRLSFTYGSSPVRYAKHQIAFGGTANAEGKVTVELSSFVRTGWAANTPVQLIKPRFKAVIVPGSFDPGVSGQTKTDGISFKVRQTLR